MIGCIVIILLCIAFVLLPNAGTYALLDGILNAMILLGIAIFITVKLVKINKEKKDGRTVVRMICIIAIWTIDLVSSKNLALDIIQGTERIRLENISMNQVNGRYGIISQEYYIIGEDEYGNQIELEVNREDFEKNELTSAVVIYYKNMEKLVEIY